MIRQGTNDNASDKKQKKTAEHAAPARRTAASARRAGPDKRPAGSSPRKADQTPSAQSASRRGGSSRSAQSAQRRTDRSPSASGSQRRNGQPPSVRDGQRQGTRPRPASGSQRKNGQPPSVRDGQRQGTRPRPASDGQRRPAPVGSRKKQRRVKPVMVALIVSLALAVAVLAGIGIYAMRYANYDKIMPNVYVSGIDVGGMTREEAKAAIEAALSETTPKSLNVNLPDQVLTFSPEQGAVLMDVDSAVEKAYAYGRNSTSPFAISRAIQAAKRHKNEIDISTAVTVDAAYISELIGETADAVATELTDSTVQTDPEAHTVTVTVGYPGKSLDANELYELVYNAFIQGDYSDIDFDYDVIYPATVQLDTVYAEMTTEPVNASYNKATGEIDAEVAGYVPAVTLDKANEQLAMASPGDVLTFNFEAIPAEITYDQLSELLFRDTLASYGSIYAANWGRTRNLELACEAIDGTVLLPGDVFSFNNVVGERSADKGYKEAIVYVSGNSLSELGGGVCQVASTIYYCAMYADLEIVQREEHQFIVDYVPGGLDATVYWGSLDFQFKNSTDYPMRIEAYLSGGRCYIELIGTNITGKWCEIDSVRTASVPFSTSYTSNPDEVQSGYTGYTYAITRRVYDDTGLIRTDTTEDLDNLNPGLGTSKYAKRDEIVYGGGYEEPDPIPTPDPSPSPSPSEDPAVSPDPTPAPDDPVSPDPAPAPDDPAVPDPTPAPENPDPAPAPDAPDPAPDPEPVPDTPTE